MPITVRQMAARVERHSHHFLTDEQLPHFFMLFGSEHVDALLSQALELLVLHAVDEHRPKSHHIRICT